MKGFEIFAPLHRFQWDGDVFELAPGVLVKRFDKMPVPPGSVECLSNDEKKRLDNTTHWLTFEQIDGSELSAGEIVNLALIALWIARPTKTYVEFRFEVGQKPERGGVTSIRLLDRFQWIKGTTSDSITTNDLEEASASFREMRELCRKRGRINDALVLTLSACFSIRWQVAFVCYAAAAETLLTYDTTSGITKRLAATYACIVENELGPRNIAFRRFRGHYSVRSDIMHGRSHKISEKDRLPHLADFADMIRILWKRITSLRPLADALDGTDAQRKAYIDQICGGFSPPKT